MPFDFDRFGRVGFQEVGDVSDFGLLAGFYDRAVVVEMDGVGFENFSIFLPAVVGASRIGNDSELPVSKLVLVIDGLAWSDIADSSKASPGKWRDANGSFFAADSSE